MIRKLKSWILPKEIDFFKSLREQSLQTLFIVEALSDFYSDDSNQDATHILDLITDLKHNHAKGLKDLYGTFITPVDRESISRGYSHLYWVALSIKHLITELEAYKMYQLSEYQEVFGILRQEMSGLTEGFNLLSKKDYDTALKTVGDIIHLDNELIQSYAVHLSELFSKSEMKHILMHREILSQIKEISKRIHICANLIEDMVFKIN
ncbi:DUF47 domain-containing protein [Formosa sp. S-31]|uniref:DUF47 domain-containing protein n=1 Tax=Formosa sp. S-31 TaxID=2790949 RepID=UPI003EB7E028